MGSSEFLSKAAIDDVQVLEKCPSPPHHPTVNNVVALALFGPLPQLGDPLQTFML